MYLSSWDFPYKYMCDQIRFIELSNRKREMKFIIFGRWCSCNCSAVIMSSIQSHDNNDNLGILLQGEISCLSLFGVKGTEKVTLSTVENMVCLAFFFPMG